MKKLYISALISLAATSLLVSALPLVADLWWVFDLFTHFRLQLIAGQLLLCVLLIFARLPRWWMLVAACATLNVASARAYLLPSAERASGPATLSLMTVNVLGRNRDITGLAATIERETPDVIIVQEYRRTGAGLLAPAVAAYQHRFERPRDDNYGIALFSKHPFLSVRDFELGSTIAIDADIGLADGVSARVIGVHLSTPISRRLTSQRNAQLEALAQISASAEDRLIVAGDFNVTPFSPYFSDLLRRSGLRDAMAGRGPQITWPTFLPILGIAIDHVLLSGDWQIVEYHRLPAFGSDHYPVIVALR